MENSIKLNICFIFLFVIVFINKHVPKILELNDEIKIPVYEENNAYSNYTTDIKYIALYFPIFHNIKKIMIMN